MSSYASRVRCPPKLPTSARPPLSSITSIHADSDTCQPRLGYLSAQTRIPVSPDSDTSQPPATAPDHSTPNPLLAQSLQHPTFLYAPPPQTPSGYTRGGKYWASG